MNLLNAVKVLGCIAMCAEGRVGGRRNVYPLKVRQGQGETTTVITLDDMDQYRISYSEESAPKTLTPFVIALFDTDGLLPLETSIRSVEGALQDYITDELQAEYGNNHDIDSVQAKVVTQMSTVSSRRRALQATGSELGFEVNVTFANEPSPEAADVDSALEVAMQNLDYFLTNLSSWAEDDPELENVHSAIRLDAVVSDPNETEGGGPVGITTPETERDSYGLNVLIPVVCCAAVAATIGAGLFALRRRRQENERPQGSVGEQRIFLDNDGLFSFETALVDSPPKTNDQFDSAELSASPPSPTSPPEVNTGEDNNSDIFSGIGSELTTSPRQKLQGAYVQSSPRGRGGDSTRSSPSPRGGARSIFSFFSHKTGASQSTVPVSNRKQDKKEVPAAPLAVAGGIAAGAMVGTAVAPQSTTPHSRVSSLFTFSEEDETEGSSSNDEQVNMESPPFLSESSASEDSNDMDGTKTGAVPGDVADKPFDEETPRTSRYQAGVAASKSDASSEYGPLPVDLGATPRQQSDDNGTPSSQNANFSHLLLDTMADSASYAMPTSNVSADILAVKPLPSTKPPISPRRKSSKLRLVAEAEMQSGNDADISSSTEGSQREDNENSIDSKEPFFSRGKGIWSIPLFAGNNRSPKKSKITSPRSTGKNSPRSRSRKSGFEGDNDNGYLSDPGPAAKAKRKGRRLFFGMATKATEQDGTPVPASASRHHTKLTTADGTKRYQTEAMNPQEWSSLDESYGYSTDEQEGSMEDRQRYKVQQQQKDTIAGTSPLEDSTTPSSVPFETTTEGSSLLSTDASTDGEGKGDVRSDTNLSKQLISDLVWLEKKISGASNKVVSSPVAARDKSSIDSLSFTSDGNGSSSLETGDTTNNDGSGTPRSNKTQGLQGLQTILCRDCYAPPGKLKIVIHSTKDGPAVHTVKPGSSLEGHIFPGDLIISVDNVDTRSFTAEQVMKMMTARTRFERKITVLHFEEAEEL